MSYSQSSKARWAPTPDAFGRLLSSLDADAEQAGEKYETIRRTLVKFFGWRGAYFPEDLADETLDRVTRKLGEGETIRDVASYCQGVARLVLLENLKGPDSKKATLEEARQIPAAPDYFEQEDEQYDCLEHCLQTLSADGRQVIQQYYQHQKRAKIEHRQRLAKSLGIPLAALRSRAQRLRDKLEKCVTDCVTKPIPPT